MAARQKCSMDKLHRNVDKHWLAGELTSQSCAGTFWQGIEVLK